MSSGVSVIVCCFNSAARLPRTLEHIAKQVTSPGLDWEVIVVDNGSIDNTEETALHVWHQLRRDDVKFTVVNQPLKGLSFARARGIAVSTYDVLIFCDDDNWLAGNYIQEAYSIVNDHREIGALGGAGAAVSDAALPVWFHRYKHSFACYAQGDSDGELHNPTASLYGAGLVVRREVLDALTRRNFTPLLTDRVGDRLSSGGDTELCYAIRLLGYKLWFSSSLQFAHYIPAPRLTDKYLFSLNKSLAYCSASLIVYKYILMGKEVGPLTWWKDISYQLFLFGASVRRCLILSDPIFNRKLDIGFSYNSMKGFFHHFGKYHLHYNKIMKLKDGNLVTRLRHD